MSRVDLVRLRKRLRNHIAKDIEYGVSVDEALALADLIEKARALVIYHEGDYAALFDAFAALFDGEGK